MHGQNSGESGSSRDSLLNGIPLETEDLVIDSHDKGAKRGGSAGHFNLLARCGFFENRIEGGGAVPGLALDLLD